jgi:hypothetical protein
MGNISVYELARLFRKVKGELCNLEPDVYRQNILKYEKTLIHMVKDKESKDFIKDIIQKVEKFPEKSEKLKFLYYPHSFKSKESSFGLITNSKRIQLNKFKTGELLVRKIFYAPIEVHIFTVYWIEKIGLKIDNILSPHVYGGRLKKDLNFSCYGISESKKINKAFPGVFIPYYYKYSEWRQKALDTISKFNKEHNILVLTLDISNFYPGVDLKRCKNLVSDILSKESKELKEINDILFKMIERWNEKTNSTGLPIGLLASPILANLYLKEFDDFVINKTKPLFYGRYIDDIILVLNGSFYEIENILNKGKNILEEILQLKQLELEKNDKENCNKNPNDKENRNKNPYEFKFLEGINENKSGNEVPRIEININKQRNFFLSKDASPSIVNAIQREINELSSLRKFMPDFLDSNSKLLSKIFQIYTDAEFGDNFRKIDGVRVRRLGMSILIAKLKEISRYLPREEWKEERYSLYDEIFSLIFDPENFFENFKNICQLVQIMAKLGDYEKLVCFIKDIEEILLYLKDVEIKIKGIQNGNEDSKSDKIWEQVVRDIKRTIGQSILIALPNNKSFKSLMKFKFKYTCNSELLEDLKDEIDNGEIDINSLHSHNLELRESIYEFLISTNFKEIFNSEYLIGINNNYNNLSKDERFNVLFKNLLLKLKEELEEKDRIENKGNLDKKLKLIRLFLFPSLRIPYVYLNSIFGPAFYDKKQLTEYIRDILLLSKGIFIKKAPITSSKIKEKELIKVKIKADELIDREKVKIGITNFLLDESEISKMLKKRNIKTKEKYINFAKIINDALEYEEHIDYLIFPELSLPRDWIIYCSNNLSKKRISLISGGEYIISNGKVINPVYSLLYASTHYANFYFLIQEEKIHFAPRERTSIKNHKYSVKENTSNKILYQHGNFQFSNLICFDVADIKLRALLRGMVDALFVVSFNKDLEYFNSIIESTARDLHCYIAIVNTGKYGDSRIRGPYRENFKRDIVKIKGGKNSYLVVGEIDIKALRKFHSQFHCEKDSLFKPHPPAFHKDIDSDRKTWNW